MIFHLSLECAGVQACSIAPDPREIWKQLYRKCVCVCVCVYVFVCKTGELVIWSGALNEYVCTTYWLRSQGMYTLNTKEFTRSWQPKDDGKISKVLEISNTCLNLG